MSGVDGVNAPPSLTPAVLASLTSQPAAAEWLLSHAQHHILYHQQQLYYWTSFLNELAAVRNAQHAANSVDPKSSSPASSPTNNTNSNTSNALSSNTAPTAVTSKNLFINDLAKRLNDGPPRSRAHSATGGPGAEDSEQQSPIELDRSPSSLTHARRPGMKKNVKSTHANASFNAQPGLNRSASEESEAGGEVGKEESQDEEKSVAVAIPVAMPVTEANTSSFHHGSPTSYGGSSHVPIIHPNKGQVPPPVPKSASSGTTSPATSTPPSPSSAAMMAAIRRPPPVPPAGGKSGSTSVVSSQPSSPIVKGKPPIPPPVPAHDLTSTMTPPPVPASVTPSSTSSVPAFQPRSLPQAPQRGGNGMSTPNRGTPATSPTSTATSASLPPPVPDLPVTSSSEDYLAAAVPLANAPFSADGTPPEALAQAQAQVQAPAATVGNRLGGIGGFKLPGAGGGDNSDLMAKLAKKREAADGAQLPTPALPSASTTTTTSTTTATSSTPATTTATTAADIPSTHSTPTTLRTASSATTSPISLKPLAAPTNSPPPAVAVAVPACVKCGCNDFKQNAFQKGKCNNCFHPHS